MGYHRILDCWDETSDFEDDKLEKLINGENNC